MLFKLQWTVNNWYDVSEHAPVLYSYEGNRWLLSHAKHKTKTVTSLDHKPVQIRTSIAFCFHCTFKCMTIDFFIIFYSSDWYFLCGLHIYFLCIKDFRTKPEIMASFQDSFSKLNSRLWCLLQILYEVWANYTHIVFCFFEDNIFNNNT